MSHQKPEEFKPQINYTKIPNSILYTGKFLQAISTNLATKFAIKIFRTPIKFKTPEREKMMERSAQKELVLIPELQKKVMVYSYGYSKRKVLLVHGWSGRGTQLYKIADKLLENGFMTISFDGPAHGHSTGKTTMMNEFVSTIMYLEKKHGPFEFAIGHSLGGMAVLNSIKQGLQVKKAISISAGCVITDIIKDFVNKLELKPVLVSKIKNNFHRKFGEDIDNYSANVAAQKVTIPTFVIHDSNDKDVHVSCAHNIRQNLQQGELLVTNGLGHRRILKDDFVIKRIMDFIKREENNEKI
ncbi:MAG: alpha/beta hydrolase [Lutibacter sp.]|uniref:alpha/beta hydrolase family protein n=1 Tax=Lutibacter sp. TaxID=1925666 RepID=UPI00299E74B0|nr:alpha/beta hydrolase [Lutibacter sp.]MDX1830246.1 alpha/beta hydrolase [Lutibacter sp.]